MLVGVRIYITNYTAKPLSSHNYTTYLSTLSSTIFPTTLNLIIFYCTLPTILDTTLKLILAPFSLN